MDGLVKKKQNSTLSHRKQFIFHFLPTVNVDFFSRNLIYQGKPLHVSTCFQGGLKQTFTDKRHNSLQHNSYNTNIKMMADKQT